MTRQTAVGYCRNGHAGLIAWGGAVALLMTSAAPAQHEAIQTTADSIVYLDEEILLPGCNGDCHFAHVSGEEYWPGAGSVASPQDTTYSVHHLVGADLDGNGPEPISCFFFFNPQLPGALDDIVRFDNITEPLRTDVFGVVPTVVESETVQVGARRLLRINTRSPMGTTLFPSGIEVLGTPMTAACFSIGIDDPLDWAGGDQIVSATIQFLVDEQTVHGPTNIAPLMTSPWDGRVNVTLPNAAGTGINGVRVEIILDKSATVQNDRCRDQIEVTDGNIAFSTVGATTDGPEEPQACRFNSFDNIGSDIWYRYNATCNGQLTVDLCESSFDTKVAVYAGCRQCPVVSPPLVCNDDFCGVRSLVTTPAQQGNCYTIRVGGYFHAQGNGVMKIRCNTVVPTGACCSNAAVCLGTLSQIQCQQQNGVWHEGTNCSSFVCPIPTPPNNECGDCVRLLTGVPYGGTTLGATGSDISSCTFNDTKDVWHCWTADCTGRVRIGTCASGFDTSLAVYDGCDGNQIACNDDGCGSPPTRSQLDLNVTEGSTYYLRVSGASGAVGSYQIVVDPCRNACCINNGSCQNVQSTQCLGGGGRPAGPGLLCLGDHDNDGVDDVCETCPDAIITDADPPGGTLDARQPHPPNSAQPRQGIGSQGGPGVSPEPIMIRILPRVGGAEDCFTLCETAEDPLLGPNGIKNVTYLGGGVYRLFLNRPITAGAVTKIKYTGGPSFVQYISHPANVNGDAAASPADILDLIDHLNGVRVPPLSIYGCDLDRTGQCVPADILAVIDLLNGAGLWQAWNGTQRPTSANCP